MAKRLQPERRIEGEILEYLNLLPDCFAWKSSSVGTYSPNKGVFLRPKGKHRIRGVSDIIGVYRGRFIAVEVKSKAGRATQDQLLFIDSVRHNGGVGFIARSVNDVQKALEREFSWWAG